MAGKFNKIKNNPKSYRIKKNNMVQLSIEVFKNQLSGRRGSGTV